MSRPRRSFTDEFKLQVVQEVLAGASQASVSRRHSVSANTILLWQKAYKSGRLGGEATGAAPTAEVRALEQQVADLQRLVGKKEEQIEFLHYDDTCATSVSKAKLGSEKDVEEFLAIVREYVPVRMHDAKAKDGSQ